MLTQKPQDDLLAEYELVSHVADPGVIVKKFRPNLAPFEAIYRQIHQDPELSLQERNTAKIAAEHIKKIGYHVTENIGGHGLVGLLKNGPGKIVLLRADMDALPLLEKNDLDYASNKTMKDVNGIERPVMHACGHDMHVAALLAAATLLYDAKSEWSGTLIVLFQPNEEQNGGAEAMVKHGLYDKIVPIPDVILGQHVVSLRSGAVAIRSGPALTAADSFDVTVFGKGGHAGTPQHCIDPILLASHIIIRLQSIISREIAPADIAVITCASIHAGSAGNIIPEQVDFKLNVRTYDESVRSKVLKAIKRIITAEAEAAGVERLPIIKQYERTPMTVNDPEKTDTVMKAFQQYFGEDLRAMELDTATEDFDNLASVHRIPYVYWNFGGTEANKWNDAEKKGKLSELIPENHSPFFAPVIEPTLQTGTDAFSLSALTFLV
ncbi:peptidase family M20/M25/M40 protein [Bisporella sp. PMI_857]|nr:peptidase family M20/M25/M40 protein [Bisporella sp. PMI_857]